MRKFENCERESMGRKAETIYTAARKNCIQFRKRSSSCSVCKRDASFEEQLKRNAAPKACYVYINGVSMPVLSA